MTITYTPMAEADVKSVLDFFLELKEGEAEVSFTELCSEALVLESLLDPLNHFFLAWREEEIVGVLRARQGSGNQDHAALLTIAIAEKQRGKGYGRALMEYGMEQLKARGIHLVRANIYSDNLASIFTVLSAGFTLAGCVCQHHRNLKTGEMVDDLIFHRELF